MRFMVTCTYTYILGLISMGTEFSDLGLVTQGTDRSETWTLTANCFAKYIIVNFHISTLTMNHHWLNRVWPWMYVLSCLLSCFFYDFYVRVCFGVINFTAAWLLSLILNAPNMQSSTGRHASSWHVTTTLETTPVAYSNTVSNTALQYWSLCYHSNGMPSITIGPQYNISLSFPTGLRRR